VRSVVNAFEVLRAFRHAGDDLRLRDVVTRTGFRKGTCFRLLYTLNQCGVVERDRSRYHLTPERQAHRHYRVGYIAQERDGPERGEVRASLLAAAERERIALITFDESGEPEVVLRNVELLVRERVDLVIEFQTDETLAPAILCKCLQANIPVIAIENPHPGATYFGTNDYEAGRQAGRFLGRLARLRFSNRVDEILLLDVGRRGSPQPRLRGVQSGIAEERAGGTVVTLDGGGRFETSLERVRKRLRESQAKRFLIAAINDRSALGALRAFREAGRSDDCAIVGQNAEPEARAELRKRRSPFVASVVCLPQKYGDAVIQLALEILCKRRVAPAVFARHELITHENVDHFYPNDLVQPTSTRSRA
jgi:ribose transport system substrate-binding protein